MKTKKRKTTTKKENKPISVPSYRKYFFLIHTDEGLISLQEGSPPSSDSGLQLCPSFGSTALEFLALKSRLEKHGEGNMDTEHLSSVQSLSRVQCFVTPWIAAHQASRPSPTLRVHSDSCPSSWWCYPAISSSVIPFSSRLEFFPHQGLFKWVSSSHQVAKILEFQLQHRSFQWTFRTDFL